eukprot:gene19855-25805_t
MFIDESAFDIDDDERVRGNGSSSNHRPTTSNSSIDFSSNGRYGGRSSVTSMSTGISRMSVNEIDRESSEETNGPMGIAEASSSRARMLAQQREIQMKKRQSAVQSGGMIRSSIDKLPARGNVNRSSIDSQFTPAVRQFSAPKSFRDSETVDEQSEFNQTRRLDDPITRSSLDNRRSTSRLTRDSSDEENYESINRSNRRRPTDREEVKQRRDNRNSEDDVDHYSNRRSKDRDRDSSIDRRGRDSQSEDFDYDEVYQKDRERERERRQSSNRSKEETIEWDRERSTAPSRDRQSGFDSRENRNNWETSVNKRETSREMRDSNITVNVPAPLDPPPQVTPLNLSNMKQFLTSPVPRTAGVVQCYIRRIKGVSSMFPPVYNLYLKDGDRFLMTSKKRPNNKTSNYLISMAENDLNRESGNYLGKLRSNFVGTEFQVYDNGVSPKESATAGDSVIRKELASIMYAANLLGSRGPRKMQVCIPTVDENDRIITWRTGTERDDILNRMKDRNYRDLVYLINKPPRWNEVVGAYVLNFNGRVTMASVKNFQLVSPDEQNTVVLQFGKVAKEEFSMDLQWPCSPLQAFAITLSSFDSKIACD